MWDVELRLVIVGCPYVLSLCKLSGGGKRQRDVVQDEYIIKGRKMR